MNDWQTTIDLCADGTWEGMLLLGSNLICRVGAATFMECARLLMEEMEKHARASSS